ncbi:D-alanine--D-alanine ligase B [Candidatus Erwinia haradaeae]|uniref:D-alanine--D-alanine ligase n=1 Tax=Candidatus Erwinia haradaeae TaxID=1922217 RepID=A0A451DJZ5_9GAMM|nr:D-alanine--D-alanine ligase [Candidatus Erwinia haradaeae]VFP87014.1 D-alanine--D-alanine ligase B [Candidatus Erwinia haradaeae]
MAGKVAVLMGGCSSEREISLLSGQAVLHGLKGIGVNAYPVDTRDFPIVQLKQEGFIKAFITLHGQGGEDGTIQAVLEHLKIPYTGSRVLASALSIDKIQSKYLWKGYGLSTSPFISLHQSQINGGLSQKIKRKLSQLGLPVFVKPNCSGSSLGVSRVNYISDLEPALINAFRYDKKILIEAFLSGDEYTVGVIGTTVLPSLRIQCSREFYNYHAKYISRDTKYFCPSGLSIQQEEDLKSLSLAAWNALGCAGCGRIDVMADSAGRFYLLEVNTSPGMSNHSLLPMAASKAGISFSELVGRILDLAN